VPWIGREGGRDEYRVGGRKGGKDGTYVEVLNQGFSGPAELQQDVATVREVRLRVRIGIE